MSLESQIDLDLNFSNHGLACTLHQISKQDALGQREEEN